MSDYNNENGTYHYTNDYTSPNPGYDQSTFDTTESSPFIVMEDSVKGIMTGVFMYMFIALLVTGITAVFTASSPAVLSVIFGNPISLILLFVLEFGVVIAATSAMRKNNVTLSAILFFAYAVINGLTFSVIFLAYTASSIQQAFFSTAVVFGLMAFFGFVTKMDLSSIGNILMIGLLGVIITSVVNIFIGSSMLETGISIVAVLIFLGLTAYDVQKIRVMADGHSGYSPAVLSLWGAMELYLDFINLFLRILRLMGRRD